MTNNQEPTKKEESSPELPRGDENLKEELARCQKKSKEYLDGWKRAKADYINFKKETEKQHREIIQFANAVLVLQILPIYDNFKKALGHLPKESKKSEWVVGIFHIKKQFDDLFWDLGIEEIKTLGEKFDPELHEASAREKKEGFEAGQVIQEIKGGYKMHGRVIVPAKVVVSE